MAPFDVDRRRIVRGRHEPEPAARVVLLRARPPAAAAPGTSSPPQRRRATPRRRASPAARDARSRGPRPLSPQNRPGSSATSNPSVPRSDANAPLSSKQNPPRLLVDDLPDEPRLLEHDRLAAQHRAVLERDRLEVRALEPPQTRRGPSQRAAPCEVAEPAEIRFADPRPQCGASRRRAMPDEPFGLSTIGQVLVPVTRCRARNGVLPRPARHALPVRVSRAWRSSTPTACASTSPSRRRPTSGRRDHLLPRPGHPRGGRDARGAGRRVHGAAPRRPSRPGTTSCGWRSRRIRTGTTSA